MLQRDTADETRDDDSKGEGGHGVFGRQGAGAEAVSFSGGTPEAGRGVRREDACVHA
ncbi:uncharacterized protein PHACADRAFT_254269 [Phanerochaete carnosa HHB-10118-sp]|uniref:Uncharacterized protein n=1 Tax=Phanerochaete carnosa (strain HHB-10118-sp) TaxID=650164 RepID=K5VZA5_PHACS|nr:uncharacterized protein PHACADRAFT_254269 [Phanerochaete carnosa HHB-10118-sp]EKM56898.1 hypothetical protein PHACADRAFT_254269 [Phanerochaete carnosa HHB-10118-sp]